MAKVSCEWPFISSLPIDNRQLNNGTTDKQIQNIDGDFDLLSLSQDLLVSQPSENNNDVSKKPPRRRRKERQLPPVIQISFYDKYNPTAIRLGEGAHSYVFLATNKSTNESVAVKSVAKSDGYNRRRILTEIDLLYHCKNQSNILQLLEFFEEDTHFFLIFEHMKGGPLLDHIERRQRFTEKEASTVTKDICKALRFLHRKGIAHRDLKPQNILCQYEDRVGSVEFMAPEVVNAFNDEDDDDDSDPGIPSYDKRCDLWSLGVIVYIMLSGKPPFEVDCGTRCPWKTGGPCRECHRLMWHRILDGAYGFPTERWSHVSDNAKDLISKLLVRDAKKRLTADEVLDHPWLANATDTVLHTPSVLSSSNASLVLTGSSKVMTYGRFVAEKEAENTDRFQSTPPTFGLSPPGNSSLARRRAQSNKQTSTVGTASIGVTTTSLSRQMTND